jgi:glycopeptide antibiotics resistance protein
MKSLAKALLAVYLLILTWLVLFKFSVHLSLVVYPTRVLNLIPFAYFSRADLRELFYNVVFFIPMGVLLSVNFKRATFWRRLACVFLFSLAAETVQFAFAIGIADVNDVITNTFGGLLGLMLYGVVSKYVDDDKLDRFIVVAGTILLIVFVLLFGSLLSRNLPFRDPPGKLPQTLTRYSESLALRRPPQALDDHISARGDLLPEGVARYNKKCRSVARCPQGGSLQRPVNLPASRERVKRWSPLVDRSIDCSTTERPHRAHGRCKRCDDRWRWCKS